MKDDDENERANNGDHSTTTTTITSQECNASYDETGEPIIISSFVRQHPNQEPDPLDWSQRSDQQGPRLRISPTRTTKKKTVQHADLFGSNQHLHAPKLSNDTNTDDSKWEKVKGVTWENQMSSSTGRKKRSAPSRKNKQHGSSKKPQFRMNFVLVAIVLIETAFINYLISRYSSGEHSSMTTTSSSCDKTNNNAGPAVERETKELVAKNDNQRQTIHVLFGMKGIDEGFLSEFEVALKSVLMNAPLEYDMNIHIMADGFAYDSLPRLFKKFELKEWKLRNQVTISTYQCGPYVDKWRMRVGKLSRDVQMDDHQFLPHSIGAWFRLFAHEVLPKTVENVLYLDSDVVIMANIGELWRHIDTGPLFYIGESESSGFIVLNVQKIDSIWTKAAQIDLLNITNALQTHAGDQLLLRAIKLREPSSTGTLPQEWDLSVANKIWKYKRTIVKQRPKVGMFHFSGGHTSKKAYFEGHDFLQDPKLENSWGVAKYYVRMPWPWARFIAQSITRDGIGYPIRIDHEIKSYKTIIGRKANTGDKIKKP